MDYGNLVTSGNNRIRLCSLHSLLPVSPPTAYIVILRTVCDRWQYIRYDGLCRDVSFAVIQKFNEWERVLLRLFTQVYLYRVLTIMVLTVMLAETLRERAGFCKTADVARLNQTFDDGHVCILRGVTHATLIFLLDLMKLLRLESE